MIAFARTVPPSPAIYGQYVSMLISQKIYSDIPRLLYCTLEHIIQIVEWHMIASQPIGCSVTNSIPNWCIIHFTVLSVKWSYWSWPKNIAPSYYEAVGISLGIPHAQLENILIQKSTNYTNALLSVFMRWNVMQQPPHSNKRQLLANKLREIDLGGLSDRLLNGPPMPNSTGKQILILATPEDLKTMHKHEVSFYHRDSECSVFYTFATIYRIDNFLIRPHACFLYFY